MVSGWGTPGSTVTIYARQDNNQVFGCSALIGETRKWACAFMHELLPGTWRFDALEVHVDSTAEMTSVTDISLVKPGPDDTPDEVPELDQLPLPAEAATAAGESAPASEPVRAATEAGGQGGTFVTRAGPAPLLLAGTALVGTGAATLVWVGRRRPVQD